MLVWQLSYHSLETKCDLDLENQGDQVLSITCMQTICHKLLICFIRLFSTPT